MHTLKWQQEEDPLGQQPQQLSPTFINKWILAYPYMLPPKG
jgi:hypothetical protein